MREFFPDHVKNVCNVCNSCNTSPKPTPHVACSDLELVTDETIGPVTAVTLPDWTENAVTDVTAAENVTVTPHEPIKDNENKLLRTLLQKLQLLQKKNINAEFFPGDGERDVSGIDHFKQIRNQPTLGA